MRKLTWKQEQALRFIQSYSEENGVSPTLRELCRHMDYKAIGSAQDMIAALRKKDFLKTPDRQAARSFVLTDKARMQFGPGDEDHPDGSFTVPCLGSVPAGNPLEAVEEREGELRVSGALVPPRIRRKNLFALQARGASMIEAGILDGDWLIVESRRTADPGTIVVARVGEDEATVKRLAKDQRKGWYLQPENQKTRINRRQIHFT